MNIASFDTSNLIKHLKTLPKPNETMREHMSCSLKHVRQSALLKTAHWVDTVSASTVHPSKRGTAIKQVP